MKKRVLVIVVAALMTGLTACSGLTQNVAGNKTETTKAAVTAATTQAATTQAATAALANPWVDTDQAGVMKMTGLEMGIPEGALDVTYRVNESEGLAEMNFTLENGEQCTARIKATAEAEDISGMNYKWEYTEEGELNGRPARFYMAEDGNVQLCTWFDIVPGISYSLSVTSDHDMNGFDITAVALGVFEPLQGDVSGEEEGDLVSQDFSQVAGKYTSSYDGSTLELGTDGSVKIGITRLTYMEGTSSGIYKGIVMITVKDANDNDMELEFVPESGSLIVTNSTWQLLPNGESFTFDKKE